MKSYSGLVFLATILSINTSFSQNQTEDIISPIGFSIGDLSKGERIITFHRLFPIDNTLSMGHEFPTATQYSKNEVEIFLHLGKLIGWNLYATLYRHPTYPSEEKVFSQISEPSHELVYKLEVVNLEEIFLPGLKIACFMDGQLIAYILDTRNVSLAERNMQRPVAGGYDMTQKDFLSKVYEGYEKVNKKSVIIIFE